MKSKIARHKKAQMNEQFNWIFATVAGGILLLFFLFVYGQIQSSADAELAITVLNNFDAILTGSQVTPNTLNIIDSTSFLGFDISCESDGLSELTLQGSSSRIDLTQKIIFSPSSLSGNKLFIYASPLERPFYIGNALLMTEPKILFLVLNPTKKPSLSKIFQALPENITKEEIGLFSADVSSYNQIVVISDKQAPKLNENYELTYGEGVLKDKNVHWIQVQFESDQTTPVSAVFSKKTNRQKVFDESKAQTVDVPNSDFLTYLAFSKDSTFYLCNAKKINKKLSIASLIYYERSFALSNALSLKTSCITNYLEGKSILKKISESSTPFYETDLLESLRKVNRGLLLESCPLLY